MHIHTLTHYTVCVCVLVCVIVCVWFYHLLDKPWLARLGFELECCVQLILSEHKSGKLTSRQDSLRSQH